MNNHDGLEQPDHIWEELNPDRLMAPWTETSSYILLDDSLRDRVNLIKDCASVLAAVSSGDDAQSELSWFDAGRRFTLRFGIGEECDTLELEMKDLNNEIDNLSAKIVEDSAGMGAQVIGYDEKLSYVEVGQDGSINSLTESPYQRMSRLTEAAVNSMDNYDFEATRKQARFQRAAGLLKSLLNRDGN